MSETRSVPARYPRLNRLIEAMDRPLLVLAGIAMVLYLLDLHGVSNWWAARTIAVMTLAIDVIFALDVALKLVVQRSAYTESPWFLIDLMSACRSSTRWREAWPACGRSGSCGDSASCGSSAASACFGRSKDSRVRPDHP